MFGLVYWQNEGELLNALLVQCKNNFYEDAKIKTGVQNEKLNWLDLFFPFS